MMRWRSVASAGRIAYHPRYYLHGNYDATNGRYNRTGRAEKLQGLDSPSARWTKKEGRLMLTFLRNIFNDSELSPHGFCLLWRPELVWLHIISDFLIGISYCSIPLALTYFVF